MVMAVDRVLETVSMHHRPSFQQSSVFSHLEFAGQQRHKQEVKVNSVLQPVKYAVTAFLHITSTHKRYRTRTFYQPKFQPTSFVDTTYATPKTETETFVSFLDVHPDQLKRKFKTKIEIKPQNFKSVVSYPSVNTISTNSSSLLQSRLVNGDIDNSSSSSEISTRDWNGDPSSRDDLDENMNRKVPTVFKEIYDPGASQVYIPQRKLRSEQDILLENLADDLLIDFSTPQEQNGLYNGYHDNRMSDF